MPYPTFYLVGGYLRDDTPRHDIDIVGVYDDHAFETLFGYTHKTLMQDYKKKPYPEKLEGYRSSCRAMSWALSSLFGKYVDFKWITSSMLLPDPKPHIRLHLTLDVMMYL